jgi:chromosomal replication initiator protein
MKSTNRVLMFNPESTFKSFVYGPNGQNNTFAYAAALAVAENPGNAYNPLFIRGGVGLGKTHLLNAIGQYISSNNKAAHVAYLSAETLTGEYEDAIQNNQLAQFRTNYLQTDVLLIDDIQFLIGKERVQEELFHTFVLRHEQHKQIVMAGRCSLSEFRGLERRLLSPFEWALVTDLHRSEVETPLPMPD